MKKWKCPKCENEEYEKDQFQATGGNFAKVFDVQNKKFITISCTKCGYTELYKAETTAGMNIFDFLMNCRPHRGRRPYLHVHRTARGGR